MLSSAGFAGALSVISYQRLAAYAKAAASQRGRKAEIRGQKSASGPASGSVEPTARRERPTPRREISRLRRGYGEPRRSEGRDFDYRHAYGIICRVSTVPEIIDAVKRLNEEQKNQFLAKLAEVDFDDAWDRQMEADAKAGRLDFLWKDAKQEIAAGKTRPLDELLGHE